MNLQKAMTLSLIFLANIGYSQLNKEDYVYAGRSFTWGMNMSSYDVAILLRADGTFCENLDSADWQTNVSGHYKKTNNEIILQYVDKTVENDTISMETDEEGYQSVYFAGAQMVKMSIANKVPPGYYNFSSASSSGGMGTGMIYVGTQNHESFNFYANGTFDTNSSGGVMVSGENIGGGTSSENQDAGTFTIKNSLLTLSFNDGHSEKHSFFYDTDGGEEYLVLIDGSIFFYGTDNVKQNEIVDEEDTIKPNSEKKLSSKGRELLLAVKETHGGNAIDELKTVKAEVLISGMKFSVQLDCNRSYIRLQSLAPNFDYIEQLEGESGWVFQNNGYNEISEKRIQELKLAFITGIFGLQNQVLEKSTVLDIVESDDDFVMVNLEVNTKEIGYIIDTKDNSLAASLILKNGQKEVTYLSEFKKIDNILLPFKEITVTEGDTIEMIYKNYILNPTLKESDWSKN